MEEKKSEKIVGVEDEKITGEEEARVAKTKWESFWKMYWAFVQASEFEKFGNEIM